MRALLILAISFIFVAIFIFCLSLARAAKIGDAIQDKHYEEIVKEKENQGTSN